MKEKLESTDPSFCVIGAKIQYQNTPREELILHVVPAVYAEDYYFGEAYQMEPDLRRAGH